MIKPIEFVKKSKVIPVDDWVPEKEDLIFRHCKDAILLPVSEYFGVSGVDTFNYFILSAKRCYNGDKLREHTTHYLNYFIKFYDTDKELLAVYYKLKFMIDFEPLYDKEAFIYDIKKYIFSPSILYKVDLMNRDNYSLKLDYKNKKDPSLQYTDKHGYILMKISVLMNILIPLITHFIYVKKIENSNDFILEVYDIIFSMFNVDIYSKLYETSYSNIIGSERDHSTLWAMQSIRGKNTTTHTLDSVINIILNIIPKYNYNENIIHFNYRSIVKNTGYQVVDIGYECKFVPLSMSKRDAEQNSEFDKFESFLTKQDESLYIQNKVNCDTTMRNIELMFGPFDEDEIKFYMDKIGGINDFQKELIFNLFYKYFGDPISIKSINKIQYIKLLIVAKRILLANRMVILPYIISSKITRLVTRKNLNKKEQTKVTSSELYQYIVDKYKSEKIEKYILSLIATILSSSFEILDFYDDKLNGQPVELIPDIVCEEIMLYVTLI